MTYTLSNGVEIPFIGFGTWKLLEEECVNAVTCALHHGYRHIDTATAYRNEKSIGKAIRHSHIDRKELFITNKLWNSSKGYESTINACKKSLEFLELEYLDLYLIHWPLSKKHTDCWKQLNCDTWKAFETLYRDGLVRSIGVSNFCEHHLLPLIEHAEILPMVNQLELSPQCRQDSTVEFSRKYGMIIEAYSPLTRANSLNSDELLSVAKKHSCSPAQVCLRWSYQQGYIPLPKSAHESRIKENLDILSFTLDEDDMKLIDNLKTLGRVVADPDDPPF